MAVPSVRAQIIERRTYLRPLDDDATIFESSHQALMRVIGHQEWLWERAQGRPLNHAQMRELGELMDLIDQKKITLAGRTKWLGGTDISKRREASQFNCSFANLHTVHDAVDLTWLLLQGCGVGFRPIVGILNGFSRPIEEIEVIRSTRTGRGRELNVETFIDGVWKISVGDSAEAWAKALGKLLAGKFPARKLVLDFSQIRPAGTRLKGYGWISSGDEKISEAFAAIAKIMSMRAGKLLTRIDLLDIINWAGTILSSRRSAEIGLMAWGEPEWQDFALAKRDYWLDNPQRGQSNNSLLFYGKPTRRQLKSIFDMILAGGGSEPGFINAVEALRRAPYFAGVNPCAEILLGDKSFCNLVETVLPRFNGDEHELHRAHSLVARANYRQTCVNLDDGVLQRTWHELNQFLRLTGVGVTGSVAWEHQNEAEAWQDLRKAARSGADSMADELGLPRSQLVTTIKPSGTASKVLGLVGEELGEGLHKPLGRYVFNNVQFSTHDPLVERLAAAGYRVFEKPGDSSSMLIALPVEYGNIPFDRAEMKIGGRNVDVDVNLESAVAQLERYKMTMENYVDHNASITVSYDESEVPEIVDWIADNWNSYVGVSFLFRNDPTKTAADLGYQYLPQEVVDRDTYHAYVDTLKQVDVMADTGGDLIDAECSTGGCPVR